MSAIEEGGYRPGAVAELIRLHMNSCASKLELEDAEGCPDWISGAYEASLAEELSAFFRRYDPERDLFYCLWRKSRMLGAITLDADGADPSSRYAGAHLRWFVVGSSLVGSGLERHFLIKAMHFANERRYPRVWTTTVPGVDAGENLLSRFGFREVREYDVEGFCGGLRAKRWEARLPYKRS